jgi:hypothetical protein
MNEKETLPPAPETQTSEAVSPAQAADIVVCPTCKRKLLTQTSPLCNWCGTQIDSPEYQARAAQSRLERDQQERAELEAVIQEEAQHGILGRLKRLGKQNKVAPPKNPLA